MEDIRYMGNLEGLKNGLLTGWVKRSDSDEPVTIGIRINGEQVDTVRADALRKDLANQGIGQGLHGFAWLVPARFRTGSLQVEIVTPTGFPSKMFNQSATFALGASVVTEQAFWAEAPWIDRPEALEELQHRVLRGDLTLDDYGPIHDFIVDGFCVLPRAIAPEVIDKLAADIDAAFADGAKVYLRWPGGDAGGYLSDIASDEEAAKVRGSSAFRLGNFHNTSEAAAEITLAPRVVDLVRKIFDGDVIATRSVTLESTTQQPEHMDFATERHTPPAFLVGALVACEDVHSDAGPPFFYPGSARAVPFFDFGDGGVLQSGDRDAAVRFSAYLKAQCEQRRLPKVRLVAGKGDVILWRASVVRGDEKRTQRLTRRSHLSYFTRLDMWPTDKRTPGAAPVLVQRNGGYYHAWQEPGRVEGLYPLQGSPGGKG